MEVYLELSGQLHFRVTLSPSPQHQLDWKLGGPNSRSGRSGEGNNNIAALPLPGIEPRSSGPYLRLCTDWATEFIHSYWKNR